MTIIPPGGIFAVVADQILNRLKRVQGQMEGLVRMYEECRECSDVVTQIAAVRAALGSVGKELLTSEAVACLRDKKQGKLDQLLKQLFEFS